MKAIEQYVAIVNESISNLDYNHSRPASLFGPIVYALNSGGKRLRPALLLAVTDACGGNVEHTVNTALAVEIFHNFTLVHDDIMDHSDFRHGKESVVKKYGESTAILVGDTMQTIAQILLVDNVDQSCEMKNSILAAYNLTAIKVYRGQQFDVDFETAENVSVDDYILMIGLKTASLIAAACHIGAIAANADKISRTKFYEYGFYVGLAFQLQDDLLDSFGDVEVFGKKIGSDILNDKKTWLHITACNEAHDEMAAAMKLEGDAKVKAVKEIYCSLDIPKRCNALIDEYIHTAIDMVHKTTVGPDEKAHFERFALSLLGREK